MAERIRIRIEGYDHKLVDKSAADIAETVSRVGAKISGPIPLPTRIQIFTVLRSPHVDKKSREQFEMRTHKRIIDILEPTPKAIEAMRNLNMPAGVEIRIKQLFKEEKENKK